MAFFDNKKRKNAELLVKQKPRWRNRAKYSFLRKIATGTLITCILGISIWYLGTHTSLNHWFTAQPLNHTPNLQITVDTPPNQSLEENAKQQLRIKIPLLIKSLPQYSLQALADQLLLNSTFAEVLLLQQRPELLYVKIWQRTPLLQTMVDTMRYISTTGTVYGIVPNQSSPQPLPIFKGLLNAANRHFTVTSRNSLALTSFEQEVINEAVNLVQLLSREKLPVAEVEFVMHRGLFCKLSKGDLSIAFGRAPFTKKLSKLHKVLAHLADKGTSAQRIELDYLGKAFIKAVHKGL